MERECWRAAGHAGCADPRDLTYRELWWLAEGRWDHTAAVVAALGGGRPGGLNPYRPDDDELGAGLTPDQSRSLAIKQMDAFFGFKG